MFKKLRSGLFEPLGRKLSEFGVSMQKHEKIFVKLDCICAVLLALCPILQHYVGLVFNAALTVMVVLVPYLLLRVISNWGKLQLPALRVVLVMIAYMFFRVVDHGTSITELGQSGVLILFFAIAALGCIDLKLFCKAALMVSMLASALLAVQYVGFYIFKFHIQMVPTDLLLPSAEQWILGAQTGLAGITGKINDFYRPSAFFLEPSHFFIYAFPHLFLVLFGGKEKKHLYAALLISLGMVLTTSGMGIAATVGAWVLYFALYDEKNHVFSVKNIFRKRNLILVGGVVVLFALAVAVVPSVRRTVVRIFATGTGVTAITGRISKALKGLQGMTFWQWIVGVEDTTHDISYNMPGLIAAIYRHGLIGMILSVELYTKSIYKLKLPYALVAAVILITSFFSAHTHSTVGFMYFSLILLSGYQTDAREPEPRLFPAVIGRRVKCK